METSQQKSSLVEQVMELGRRFNNAKDKLDITAQVNARPFASVGIAVAAGAFIALTTHQPARSKMGGRVTQALLAALGSVAMKAIRDVAVRQFGDAAKDWLMSDAQSGRSVKYSPASSY